MSPQENQEWVRHRLAEENLNLISETDALALLSFRAELEEEGKWPQWLSKAK